MEVLETEGPVTVAGSCSCCGVVVDYDGSTVDGHLVACPACSSGPVYRFAIELFLSVDGQCYDTEPTELTFKDDGEAFSFGLKDYGTGEYCGTVSLLVSPFGDATDVGGWSVVVTDPAGNVYGTETPSDCGIVANTGMTATNYLDTHTVEIVDALASLRMATQ
jgi:hypothetical protein